MRQHLNFKQSSLWLTGIVVLLLGMFASGCTASGVQSPSQVRSSAATPTPRPSRENYVYQTDAVLLDGSPYITQVHWGQTFSITWKSHAYNQSADPSPITLSLLVYGPFVSPADRVQRMQIGSSRQSTPAPVAQLAFPPIASAPTIHADTWTTATQITTFRISTSLPAGYYDAVSLSIAGSDVMERGDSLFQLG